MEGKLKATYRAIEYNDDCDEALKILYKKVNSIKRELTDLYDLQQKKYKAEETKAMTKRYSSTYAISTSFW